MPLSYLATFNLNTYKYSGLTLAKDKGGPQAVSFYCKIKVEQEVKQSMIFFSIWKKIAEIFGLQIKFVTFS